MNPKMYNIFQRSTGIGTQSGPIHDLTGQPTPPASPGLIPPTHSDVTATSTDPPTSADPASATVLTFGPYTGSTNPEWIGFDRSLQKHNKRYMARCQYCKKIMQCRLDQMGQHKAKCSSMPENIQVQVSKPAVKAVEVQQNTIPGMFVENVGHQEKCD